MSPKPNLLKATILVILIPLVASAIERSGRLSTDETWRTGDSPVMVGELLTVERDVTLTIEPGVEVRFAATAGLVILGDLIARGTEGDSIRFTSTEEGRPGAWGGIYIRGAWEEPEDIEEEGGAPGGRTTLEYCIIEYAGNEDVEIGSAIQVTAAGPRLVNSTIRECRGLKGTLNCSNLGRPLIKNCLFSGNHARRGGAVSASVGSQAVLEGNTFTFNRSDDHGGAIYLTLASAEVISNSFLGNRADGHGGAVYAATAPKIVLRGNTFIGNSSRLGSHNLFLTKRFTAEIKDNLFDSVDSTSVMIYLHGASQDVDATGNWWGNPITFSFKDAIRDRNDDAVEPFVNYQPYLWAPPEAQPANPTRVDSIILCRDDNYTEEIPRGVAEGALLRIRLAGEDGDPHFREVIQARVRSIFDPEGIAVPLRETAPNNGIYVGRGKVERFSEQEDYTIGSREGGEVIIWAPFMPEVEVVYQTMSPKPLAEDFTVALVGKEDLTHLIDHNPNFSWGYFDVLESPQLSYQLQVFPAVGTEVRGPLVWDAGEVRTKEKSSVYNGTPLEDGEGYLAQLKVWNGRFWSETIELAVRMNSLPTVPSVTSPTPDQLVPLDRPELVAAVSTDSEGDSLTYRFELSLLEEEQPVWEASGIPATDGEVIYSGASLAPLHENRGYSFRVRAFDQLEDGEWSEPRIFYVNAREEAPDPFDLSAPEDGADIYLLHPTIAWQVAIDPDPLSSVTYTLEVDSSASFASPLVYAAIPDTVFTLPDSLANLTQYYWRVTAIDNTDRSTVSPEVRRFFVDTTPSVPEMTAPLTGEERAPADVLSWQASSDPNPDDLIFYEIEAYESPALEQMAASRTGWTDTTLSVNALEGWDGLEDNHVYHWRLRARDNHNAASQFSGSGSFFFNRYNDPPDPVEAFTAPGDTVTGTTDIIFTWQEASDPDLSDPASTLVYELQCSLGEFEEAEVREFSSEPGLTDLTVPLDDNLLWRYRIRTRDDEDAASPWSPVGTVLVNVAEDPPAPFALTSPAEDELVVELDSLMFSWALSSDPDWESSIIYRLELLPPEGEPFITELEEARYHYKAVLENEAGYSWRVTALDNTGLETSCDAGFSFRTSTTPTAPAAAPMPVELMPDDPLAFTGATDPNPADLLTYTLEVSPGEAFEPLLVHVEEYPHSEGTMTAPVGSLSGQEQLEDDRDYFFRVRATDNHGFSGPFSDPVPFRFNRENDPPEPPVEPIGPGDNEVVRSQQPELTWGAASDEDLSDPPELLVYDIRFDSDGELDEGAAFEYSSDPGATSFTLPSPLNDNTPWVWQVRTRDDDGAVSEWSSVLPILVNVEEDPPSLPAPRRPTSEQNLNILGPITFEWSASVDPDYQSSVIYNLEYGVEPELEGAKLVEGLTEVSFTDEGPLENMTYFWRVTAVDNTGLETASQVQSFILDTRPTTPEPIVTADVVELTPEGALTWTLSIDPNPEDKVTYDLQIGIDVESPEGKVAEAEAEATTLTVPMSQILRDNQVFSWRVRAIDDHGIASEWSNASKFFYNEKNDPPDVVSELLKPMDKEEVSSIALGWGATTDPDFSDTPELLSYRVELSQDGDRNRQTQVDSRHG